MGLYDHLDPECRQVCWSHLVRDFRRHSEGLALQKQFGEQGLALTGRVFHAWHAFDEHQDRARLTCEMTPIQTELRVLLEQAARKSKRTRLHKRFANNLLKIWPALWTFVTVKGVEPTNNTPPSAHSAVQSSTASSPTAHNPRTTSATSNAHYQHQSRAACKTAPCSPTRQNCSPHTPTATRLQRSPNPAKRLNGYLFWDCFGVGR